MIMKQKRLSKIQLILAVLRKEFVKPMSSSDIFWNIFQLLSMTLDLNDSVLTNWHNSFILPWCLIQCYNCSKTVLFQIHVAIGKYKDIHRMILFFCVLTQVSQNKYNIWPQSESKRDSGIVFYYLNILFN